MTAITVLVENTSCSASLREEHGLSLLVTHNGETVLFDTGASDAFLTNAAALGCDLSLVSTLALSHGHWDHTGGLARALAFFAQKASLPQVVFHPDVLLSRRRDAQSAAKSGARDLGMPEEAKALLERFPCIVSKDPVRIAEGLLWLGEVPRPDAATTALLGEVLRDGAYEKDSLLDDTAFVCVAPEGLNIIVGCAHAGIINTVERAKAVTGVSRVNALIGGLHTKGATAPVIEAITRYLAKESIPHLYACHCSGDEMVKAGLGKTLRGGESLIV